MLNMNSFKVLFLAVMLLTMCSNICSNICSFYYIRRHDINGGQSWQSQTQASVNKCRLHCEA